jgi:TIR domain
VDARQVAEAVIGRSNARGHVFISYVREDAHRVDQLQRALEAAGIPVWRDTADLWPGEDWREKIRSAITDNALVFLACFSHASLARSKSYQNAELTLAIEQMRLRRPGDPWLIPVRFDECHIPDPDIGGGRTLTSIQHADLPSDRFDEGAARLVIAILRILGGHSDAHAPEGDIDPDAPSAATSGHRRSGDHAKADDGVRHLAARRPRMSTRRYVPQIPKATTDFIATAKIPLTRLKPLYQDVASCAGISWELLAACDWMQCQARPRYSPVHGEKLGTKNPNGTIYRTKAEALEQCAADLIELAAAVYGIDLRQQQPLSVRDLANVFAAFRWGELLKAHRMSAMEFPYSVEGLTAVHMKMRWPDIHDDAPDKPGTRFGMPFGAVPIVLSLGYEAVV